LLLINNDTSIEKLKRWLRAEAARVGPGQRLPSTRWLVQTQQVSPLTVSRALAELGREGILVSKPGAGTFAAQPPGSRSPGSQPATTGYSWQTVALGERTIEVAGLSPLVDPPHVDGVISLATGYLHQSLMPLTALRSALGRAARLPDVWDRPPVLGLHALRTWFAQASGSGVDSQDVLITSGGQSALAVAIRALVPAGSVLLVESPTYPGVLAAARAAGVRPVPVPVDDDGVIPELLAEAFTRAGALAVFCQPSYHNPTGAVLAQERRAAVLGIAASARAFVIEDDVARWLSHHQHPPAPLLKDDADGRVVLLTSLSKAASPSLRVGALIARGPAASRLQALRVVDDLFVARPLQEAALDLVSRPAWERHLKDVRRALQQRAATLYSAVTSQLPATEVSLPGGGMHLWVKLPRHVSDLEAAEAARRQGVIVMPGQPFFAAEAPGSYLRLTFCGAPSEADLAIGVSRLAAALSMI
jgi:DNA-binding transcriptional MocR family regulator